MNGRLQFIHQSKVFKTNVEAKAYVEEYLIRNNFISLLAEPMVVLYGEESNPNVLLVIGNKTNTNEQGTLEFYEGNGYFFIDSAQIEADILANKESIDNLELSVEKIKSDIENIKHQIIALQEEIDNTQKGAGLAEDGSYVKNVSFENRPIHYILNAENLNDADVKLDVALQELDAEVVKGVIVNGVKGDVNDNIANITIDTSDINVEPDFSQVVPDLKEDGHLHIHSGDTVSMVFAKIEKTYETEKSKREETDKKLDAEIKRSIEKDEKLEKDLTEEINRATETDTLLRKDVDSANEKIDTFLLAADLTQDAIDTLREIQSYIGEHGEEAAKMVTDIAANRQSILEESARAIAEEKRIADEVVAVNKSLESEISRALLIEDGLRRDLDNEVNRSLSADDILRNDLSNEISNRDAADIALGVRIDTEIARAENAESALGVRIDTEIARAEDAENALGVRIDTEIARAEDAESALGVRIDTEIARAEDVENTLNGKIDSEIARALGEESLLSERIISLQEKTGVLEGESDDTKVRLSVIENAINEDRNNLNIEILNRTNADTELQKNIETLFANKVEIENGKGLSTNDFTDILLNKVNSIEDKAQVNKIEKIFVDDVLLDITDNKEVKINMPKVPVQGVYVDDNILSLNGTELSANVSIDYNKTSKQIILYGKDTSKVISTIDVSDFVKDGMIDKVEVVTLDNGKTVIRITWNTESGLEVTDVPADSLIQVYEAGEGLLKINDIFSIKLNANASENFLKVSTDGLYTEGIKQFVADSIVTSETKTNEQIANISRAIADTQTNLSIVVTKVDSIEGICNAIDVDLALANTDIDTLKETVDALKDKDKEIERLAQNSFTTIDGEGISLSLTPGSETDRTNLLSGKIKGYYTYASKPESEKDSDYSLLRLTDNGYMFVTNSTDAMKHNDINGMPHVLSSYINTLKNENITLNTTVENLLNDLTTTKAELNAAKAKVDDLETAIKGLISGENIEFMTMLKRAIINSETFKDEDTDPTVEVVVTEGVNVVVKTKEEAVYEGSKIY